MLIEAMNHEATHISGGLHSNNKNVPKTSRRSLAKQLALKILALIR